MQLQVFFTASIRSTTGGYVFTGVCLLTQEGVSQSLVPGPFPASGPMSFGGGVGSVPPGTGVSHPPPTPRWDFKMQSIMAHYT